ncbi:hypothetical protein HPB52_011755 [Rhipicephalus sanguineus]|uniref:Uncharacterized protein n=1 Tax=Rhipicephalus sanguineus TaxID=34632 RepID=A0A9D4SP46_RHISA|nr:hypothetical protein HPB52_011755 [Rhipicephalus sanguineus]
MGDASTMASSSRASSLSPPPAAAVGRRRRPRRRQGNRLRAVTQLVNSTGSAQECDEADDGSPVSPSAGDGIRLSAIEIPTAGDEEATEAWLGDPLLHEILHSRALTERTRSLEWDEYAAKGLPEDSRIRRGSPGVLLIGGIDPRLPHQVSTGTRLVSNPPYFRFEHYKENQ